MIAIIVCIAVKVAIFAGISSVRGHGNFVKPAVVFTDGYVMNGFSATLDNEIWGVYNHDKYGHGVNATLTFFINVFRFKGYNSLGALIVENQEVVDAGVDAECGRTVFKESQRSKLPASELEFSGFTHPGPCEIWCDQAKVVFAYDCQTEYPGVPAKIPYDHAKCVHANRMTIYWLALHGDPWQVYTNCAWLQEGKGRGLPPVVKGQSTLTKGGSSKLALAITPSRTIEKIALEIDGKLKGEDDVLKETTEPPSVEIISAKCMRRRE
ncbi:uncharacterized protein CCR75_001509 [Bremia lactucae]|uniref:Uncharacterized protein n=1 Tax=Bremia lactucae TaxID=4779 RepID=A0A976IBN2_BRELC|nr:hypothetical protein CCR75_001509 [Bremia lactucae]